MADKHDLQMTALICIQEMEQLSTKKAPIDILVECLQLVYNDGYRKGALRALENIKATATKLEDEHNGKAWLRRKELPVD